MIFDDALPVILVYEGGFVNDPHDHGGATNHGITQRVYDRYRTAHSLPMRSVEYIEDTEVSSIYHRNYWLDGSCDKLPAGVNLVHFDACVMSGIGQGAKLLQRALGVEADGKIGPITLATVLASDPKKIINDYSAIRRDFYTELSTKPHQSKFLAGWLNRANKCESLALASLGRGDSLSSS